MNDIKCSDCGWEGSKNELISTKEGSMNPADYVHCPICQSANIKDNK